jgi:hypothetical protein
MNKMRLFISVIATAAMFLAAGAASAEATYSAVTTVASGNAITALAAGDVVTIDVTLRSDGELTLGIGGAATGYDPAVAAFTSGTATSSFLNAICVPGAGCFGGIDNLAPAPLAQGTLSAGILVQFATGVSTAGVANDGTIDEGVDGVGGSAQFQLVFTVPAEAPDGSTTITLGSDPAYGNATIGAGGVSLVTNNASVTLTVPEPAAIASSLAALGSVFGVVAIRRRA